MPVDPVGAYLREMRERRGISLDEISRQTRVPTRYLDALEGDRPADLPAPVFVRGFIRAYCEALGEPAEHALARHDARASALPPARTPGPVVASTTSPAAARSAEARSRTRFAALVSLALLVVLGGALFSLTRVVQPRDDRRPAEMLVGPVGSDVEQASPASVPTADPAPSAAPPGVPAPAPTAPSAPVMPSTAPAATKPLPAPPPAAPPVTRTVPVTPVAPASPPVTPAGETRSTPEPAYHLIARTTEATWIRVRIEDGRTTEETLPPGAVREWVSNRPFVLTIGNAGGIVLELNGTELPPLGASGAVISRLVLPSAPR